MKKLFILSSINIVTFFISYFAIYELKQTSGFISVIGAAFFSFIFTIWFKAALGDSLWALKKYPEERIKTNIESLGIPWKDFKKNFKKRIFIASSCFFIIMLGLFHKALINFFLEVPNFFKSEQFFLKVEENYFADQKTNTIHLKQKNPPVNILRNAFISFYIENSPHARNWKIDFYSHQKVIFSRSLNGQESWQGSFDQLIAEKKSYPQEIFFRIKHKKFSYEGSFVLREADLPQVFLQAQPPTTKEKNGLERMDLTITAHSVLPMTNIVLQVKTQSGYEYEKEIVTFASENATEYENPEFPFFLSGIPLFEEDTLFLRAKASTPLANSTGYSEQIEIKIHSALKAKQARSDNLTDASSQEHVLSYFEKLNYFNQQLKLLESDQKKIEQLIKFGRSLQDETQKLKTFLEHHTIPHMSYLTQNEKKTIKTHLHKDRTEKRLKMIVDFLAQKLSKSFESESQSLALETSDLSYALYLLNKAKKNAFQKAKQNLNIANRMLKTLSPTQKLDKQKQDLLLIENSLLQTPIINKNFSHYLQKASLHLKVLQNHQSHKNQLNKAKLFQQSLSQAELFVSLALKILDDEETKAKQNERNSSMRSSYYSTQEFLSVQNQNDMTWRKKIVDAIAQLQKEQKNDHSKIIKLLESQLK
ncbi:MAG: hypothetical protein K2X39_04450 [Silvanigrellaceae bacterium]|nr:hypothetical protein [Silvanigrellaceae bacterium]